MKSLKRFFITIIALFCFINTSFGIEDVRKVYLNEAINAALKNNIDLQVAQIELNIAKNNIKSANRLQNPSFDAYYFMGASGRTENYSVKHYRSFHTAVFILILDIKSSGRLKSS